MKKAFFDNTKGLNLEAYRVAATFSKTLPQNCRDGRIPDFRNQK